jgi:glycosyltransferase involved in cell wall biosynthesis
MYYLSYRQWQRDAFLKARELHREIGFDLVHQLNMIGFREPGFLWKLAVPFLWGPIGGHAQMPWPFVEEQDGQGRLHYGMRNVLNAIQMRTSPRVRRAVRRASVLLAATPDDRAALSAIHHRPSLLVPEVGTNPRSSQAILTHADSRAPGPLTLVWCGRCIRVKALPLGLHALRRALDRGVDARLDVVGDGPCRAQWMRLSKELRLDGHCVWHGAQPHDRALALVEAADALLFTSVQDATATVVVEALQSGVPVICHDAFGFGGVVDASCGLKVPMRNPDASIDGFAGSIARLAESPALLAMLSSGALERARSMAWPVKAAEVAALYRSIVAGYRL